MSSVKTVQQIFEELAEFTWRRLRAAVDYGISQGEETITDTLLLSIAAEQHPDIHLWKCPKHLESRIGIDWEWFIGNDNDGWWRFAVQAKRVSLRRGGIPRYDNLGHKVEIGGVKCQQIDLLRNYAGAVNALPVYCLYNYVERLPSLRWGLACCSYVAEEQMGCTIAPIHNMYDALAIRGQRTFAAIHADPYVLPWRCLVCGKRKRNLMVAYLAEYHRWKLEGRISAEPGSYSRLPGESPFGRSSSDRYEEAPVGRPSRDRYFDGIMLQTSNIVGGVVPSAVLIVDTTNTAGESRE